MFEPRYPREFYSGAVTGQIVLLGEIASLSLYSLAIVFQLELLVGLT